MKISEVYKKYRAIGIELNKKIDGSDSLKRFIAFFKLSKECGSEVHNKFAS